MIVQMVKTLSNNGLGKPTLDLVGKKLLKLVKTPLKVGLREPIQLVCYQFVYL